ncbi:hypothetical protein WOLCODRAFT_105932 [Wolfiporia cocos MD-104 SS10]|uniref:Secreted protein n=1 Tax=Wolfiporia cocos (strain MD-104) TaxID=742152 RepID=A0A2H3K1A8_WOLCO|nr:hypothetical protein WOLCODRAFT_105932 [Wolfiporia cocos MD-104 SS10]
MLPFSLLLLISPLYTCALSWSKSHALVEDAATLQYETRYDDDVAMIARNAESLQLYSRQPDCFRRAAGLIRAQCGELDVNEDERVRAAISMTLCELATAKHNQPPMECAAYAADSHSDEMVSPPQSHRICVEALSRSAQYWSSYSGYLREVSQLCYAFRRWNDIDTARDIYRNATLEKLTFLRILNEREKRMQERHESTDSLMQVPALE